MISFARIYCIISNIQKCATFWRHFGCLSLTRRISVMNPQLGDQESIVRDAVNHAMLVRDPARPVA